MALLKLPFKLGRPSNDTPVTSTDAVDDETLGKSQAELNALFNQGKDSQGNQVGKTYNAGTGIDISQQDAISVKAATAVERGGIKLGVMPTIQNVTYEDFPVVGGSNGTAKVSIPTGTDSRAGLISAEDHQKMALRSLGISFAPGSDTVQWVNSYGSSISLIRLSGTNVSSVRLSYGSVLQESHALGPISILLASDDVVTVTIVRTTEGQGASLGIGIQL